MHRQRGQGPEHGKDPESLKIKHRKNSISTRCFCLEAGKAKKEFGFIVLASVLNEFFFLVFFLLFARVMVHFEGFLGF